MRGTGGVCLFSTHTVNVRKVFHLSVTTTLAKEGMLHRHVQSFPALCQQIALLSVCEKANLCSKRNSDTLPAYTAKRNYKKKSSYV